jgi:hypothetical protein
MPRRTTTSMTIHGPSPALLKLADVFYESRLLGAGAFAFQIVEKLVAGVHGAGI